MSDEKASSPPYTAAVKKEQREEIGIEIEEEDFPGRLLHQAALWDNAELLEDLLAAGGTLLESRDSWGRTALHAAAITERSRCLRLLLERGAAPDAQCGPRGENRTALHLAAEHGHEDNVSTLLQHDASMLVRDANGMTAYDIADKCGHRGCMRLLRDAADARERSRQETHAALRDACGVHEDAAAVRRILGSLPPGDAGLVVNMAPGGANTLLFLASQTGRRELVRALLEHGADGRCHPVTRYSPLYIACYHGHRDVAEMLLSRFPELVQLHTVERWLPAHACCLNGHWHVLDLLLRYPYPARLLRTYAADACRRRLYRMAFDINELDVTGQSPLYMASLLGNGRTVDIILDFRVSLLADNDQDEDDDAEDLHDKNEEEERREIRSQPEPPISPTRRRISHGIQSIMSRLRGSPNTSTETPADEPDTLCPVLIDQYCNNGSETALHAAVKARHYSIVQRLLRAGANSNAPLRSEDGGAATPSGDDELCTGKSTALVEACRNRDVPMAELLLANGATDDECRALCVAVRNRDEVLTARLLSTKANPDPEYKINKRAVQAECVALGGGVTSGGGLTSTYSSLFPNQPVMINWHNQRCHLSQVRANWLTDAALRLNSRLKQNPRRHDLALYAITRLDMSSNSLVRLPDELFRLASLRTLNLAQNKIERLPEPRLPNFTGTRDRTPPQSPEYRLPALEELYLQDNRLEELPDALFGLPSLVSLVLSNNKLQRLPYEMWRAPKLKELNVSFNLLCALPDERVLDQEGNASEKRRLLARRRDADANSADRLSVSSSDGQLSECETPRDETVPPREPVVRYAERGRGVVRLEPDRRLLWCRNVDVTEQILHAPDADSGGDGDEEADAARRVSQLSALNLAHNMFTVVPEPLACLAVNLTRLNMSFNSLRSMGYVTSYPATLKQLDLSHNQILCWPSLPPVPTRAYGDVPPACEAIACFACGGRPAPARPVSPPDAGARSMRAAVLRSVCAHRRHLRLEQLRTLILAGNRLRRLQLSTDDDSDELLSPPAEVDEGERVAALGSGGTGDRTERGSRSRLLFPNLSMLDVSDNGLHEVPAALHELANLSVLNISGNPDICELPPQMGLLSRLWNLNTRGCSLHEPLRSMIDSKKYKTMDVVGYLKSVLEDARPYARMKLMLVGVQGIGKTSLLEQLRHEGGTSRSHSAGGGGVGGVFAPADHEHHHNHWTRRMGHHHHHAEALHGAARTARGVNMSTVGVDIGDWVYERPKRAGASHGPVTFRTWDFGGQKEYYATHQYFLSRRSLYLVVWRILDGQRGIADILQWLVNIQARAPNSPVIIVGTHYDLVHERWRDSAQRSEELQQAIRDRFINVVDAEKCGLPRVLDTIEVSCRTRHNIRLLCNLLYETAFSLRPPGSKEPLLEQRVPASYLALEDAVAQLSARRRSTGFDPVLTAAEYRAAVGAEMHARRARPFRDAAELHQATLFLHENGVLLHYDDATLRDLYFLDPQWLCDMLAHVVTIREINPFARSGVMRLDDLRHLFKASGALGAVDHGRGYIVSLLNKFEVALTWDSRTLLIPSLLPDERLGQPAVRVRVPVRSRGRAAARVKPSSGRAPPPVLVSPRSLQYPGDGSSTTSGVAGGYPISDSVTVPPPLAAGEREHATPPTQPPSENAITRLLLMSYFPSGFWSRLVSRILADDTIVDIVRSYFTPPKESVGDPEVARALLELRAEWLLWQTGLRLRYGDITLFRMREVPRDFQLHQTHERDQQQAPSFPSLPNCYEPDYRRLRFRLKQEGAWGDVDLAGSSVLELHFPMQALAVGGMLLEATVEPVTQLLALAVDHIDTLLEDWYPTLGTRFVHTSEGRFLVTRLVPCPRCLSEVARAPLPPEERADDAAVAVGLEPYEALGAGERHGAYNRKSQESYTSETDSGVGAESVGSSRAASTEGRIGAVESDRALYGWTIEECILAAHETTRAVRCPMHGDAALSLVSPDVVFLDLGERYLLRPETVKRGRLLGRGAFGFVFRGTCRARGSHSLVDVALKMLQPVAPGTGARQSALVAYRAAQGKWERDPLQHACKAYCTARQELSILLSLRHPNVVPLVGVCASPLALVLDLAPGGALDARLRHYRRSGARLAPPVLRQLVLQTARAVEYLHRQRIIYRDLKSENVLVWRLPEPFAQATAIAEADGEAGTHVKLADYGISRTALPGGAKGFGGTEGFMAPEIMRHNGEQEYTEKVDCFSFGMYVYELLTLRQPFEGHESVKECILEGGRPPLTRRQTISHPPHCLDLMVLCWAHDPRRRPSASQIVSIASAPEFARLADVIALPHAGVVMAAAASPPLSGAPSSSSGQGASGQARELWLACANQRVDLLLAIGARLPRLHSLMAPRRATAACTVGAAVWLGDCTGQIHSYSAANATRLFTCGLSAIGTHGQETPVSPSEPPSVGRDEGERDVCAVLCMAYARSLTLVACGLSDGRLLLLDADSGSIVAKVRHEPSDIAQVVCVVGEELWVGGPGGRMTVYTLEKIRGRDEDSVLDAIIMLEHQQPAVEGAVVLSAVSDAEGDADGVWTYVHPGCVVYQWEARARRIANRLDCSKLVPCSESLRSIAIEEHLSPGRCQVTSMAVSGDDLYIGTTWGCLIVAERATLRPVTVFRPYEEEVKAVLPLRFAGAEPLVATVGRGYRSLLARYTDQPDEDEPLYDAGQQQGTHVLLWRADNWAAA